MVPQDAVGGTLSGISWASSGRCRPGKWPETRTGAGGHRPDLRRGGCSVSWTPWLRASRGRAGPPRAPPTALPLIGRAFLGAKVQHVTPLPGVELPVSQGTGAWQQAAGQEPLCACAAFSPAPPGGGPRGRISASHEPGHCGDSRTRTSPAPSLTAAQLPTGPWRGERGGRWEPGRGPMESETGSREAGLAPASWPCFVLEWRLQAAGARGDVGTPRDEGTLQSLGVGTVEERVHEASAGRETEQAPLLVELVLAVEDAMVLVEVVDGAAADNREEAEEEGQREGESQAVGEEEECEHEEDSGEESEQGTQFEADDQEADEKKTDPEESDEETGTDDDEETEDDRPEVDDDSEQDDAEDVAMAHEEEGEAEEEAVMSETEYMLEEEANLQEEEHEPEEAMEEGQGEEGARELQDQQQGSEHPEAGPSPLECPLEALEALRADMEPTNGRGRRSFAPFQLRLGQRRHHRLQQRSAHMQGIRGFWAKAVSLLLWGKDPKVTGVGGTWGAGGGGAGAKRAVRRAGALWGMGIPRTALVNAPRPARGGSGDDAHAPVIATALAARLRVGSSWAGSSPEAARVKCAGRHAVRVTRGSGSRVSALATATRKAPFRLGTLLQPGGCVCPPLTWSPRARDVRRPGSSPLFLAVGPQACAVDGVRGGACLGIHSSRPVAARTWAAARGPAGRARCSLCGWPGSRREGRGARATLLCGPAVLF